MAAPPAVELVPGRASAGRRLGAHSTDGPAPSAHSSGGELKELPSRMASRCLVGVSSRARPMPRRRSRRCWGSPWSRRSPSLVHKSDAGGVIVGVTPSPLPASTTRVEDFGGRVWVEEQVDGGIEALVGFAPAARPRAHRRRRRRAHRGRGRRRPPGAARVADEIDAMLDETRLGAMLGPGSAGHPRQTARPSSTWWPGCARSWTAGPPGFELDLNPVTVLAEGRGVACSTPPTLRRKEPDGHRHARRRRTRPSSATV